MVCKKLDFIDIELEETVKGYLIIDENEIIAIFDGYNKQEIKKFNKIEEIVQELMHTKEMLNITEKMLDEETERADDYEEILKDIFGE